MKLTFCLPVAPDPTRIDRAVRVMMDRYSFRVSGELRVVIITALWSYVDQLRSKPHPLYTVDEWRPGHAGIARQIATANDFAVALAAYDAAVARAPTADITLRTGARLIRPTRDEEQAARKGR